MEFQGVNLNEYLLIIEPENPIRQQIQSLKRYFKARHRFDNAIVSKAHLTLMRFLQYESYEGLIIRRLRTMASSIEPFIIELQNFGTFGHAIYIDVKTVQPVLDVVYNRRSELRPFVYSDKSTPVFIRKPHITVARRLTPPQCSSVWALWHRMSYHASFRASHMVLLSRRAGTRTYRQVAKFTFGGHHLGGQNTYFVQGRLFG